MKVSMDGGQVVIDGKSFSGSNISISNGKVTVDGVVQDGSLSGDVNVVIHGDVQMIESQSGIVTAQNVGEINTGSGDVKCGDVGGSIRTGSGDVDCSTVAGNIRTGSGDVTHR